MLEAIDQSFTSLGETSKVEIYLFLEKKLGLKRQKIPDCLEEFSDALEFIFGKGARLLEILIMKNLHARVKAQYTYNGPSWIIPDLSFRKLVLLQKLAYEDRGMIGELNILVDVARKDRK